MFEDRTFEDDHRLLERALAGDDASFTALYRRRQGQVYRFAFHMTASESAAEDITQETFLALLKAGGRFNPERGPVLFFLYGIARNQVLRLFEKQRDERRVQRVSDKDEEVAGNGAGVLEDMTRQETVDEVRRAVVSLPAQYREAVVLCDLEGASYEDAAAAIGCPLGTVRSRLSRGRELLAHKLGARDVRTRAPGGARGIARGVRGVLYE
jgi:RNA polymerase sigma-70 factor (ECF subfamily)